MFLVNMLYLFYMTSMSVAFQTNLSFDIAGPVFPKLRVKQIREENEKIKTQNGNANAPKYAPTPYYASAFFLALR